MQKKKYYETITFKDKEGFFVFTVKSKFLNICKKPEQHDIESLVVNYKFNKYLHNPYGLAVVYTKKIPLFVRLALLKNKHIHLYEFMMGAFWLNGKLLHKTHWKKLAKKYSK